MNLRLNNIQADWKETRPRVEVEELFAFDPAVPYKEAAHVVASLKAEQRGAGR